jgi:hypothetical protein
MKSTGVGLEALADTLAALTTAPLTERSPPEAKRPRPAKHSKARKSVERNVPSHASDAERRITIEEIKAELRLSEKQVAKLQHSWGFPLAEQLLPIATFDRQGVEAWVRWQPNPKNLAAVLRLRGTGRTGPPDSLTIRSKI